MAGDAERLAINLEARVNDLEKGMKKAQAIANKAYSGMKRDSQTATDRMEADMVNSTSRINRALSATSTKVGALGKAMVAGFAGGLVAGGISGIVTRLGQMASEVASVGDEARRAGLSFKAFQELKYVAEQNRVSVGALTDGMKELNLRADEFIVTGGGSAAEAFQRLGYTAQELNTKLQDPSALFTEIIGKLGDLDRAAQIRIADELFGGTGGEQFVQLIAQGEEGIRRTIAEANSLGIVMSDQVIAKAAEVDRKFNMIATTVGSNVKGAIVEAAAALNDFLNSLGQTPAQHFAELEGRMLGLRSEIDEFVAAAGRVVPELEPGIRQIVQALDDETMSTEEAKAALQELGAQNLDAFPITAGINGVISLMEHLTGKAREATAAMGAAVRSDLGVENFTFDDLQNTFKPRQPRTVPRSGAPGRAGSRGSSISEAEREAKAIQNLIAGLEFERSLIGLSAMDQAKMNALRQAGASATDEQRHQISMLVEATERERQAADGAAAAMEQLGDIGRSAVDGIVNAFTDGKIEGSELLAIVTDIVQQLIRMPLSGGGGGNWLSTLLGIGTSFIGGTPGAPPLRLGYQAGVPSFAGGGSTGSGSRSGGLDGQGGFPAILHPRETVIDHASGGGTSAQGVATVTLAPVYNFNGTGLGREDLLSLMSQNNRDLINSLPDHIAKYERQPRMRYQY